MAELEIRDSVISSIVCVCLILELSIFSILVFFIKVNNF